MLHIPQWTIHQLKKPALSKITRNNGTTKWISLLKNRNKQWLTIPGLEWGELVSYLGYNRVTWYPTWVLVAWANTLLVIVGWAGTLPELLWGELIPCLGGYSGVRWYHTLVIVGWAGTLLGYSGVSWYLTRVKVGWTAVNDCSLVQFGYPRPWPVVGELVQICIVYKVSTSRLCSNANALIRCGQRQYCDLSFRIDIHYSPSLTSKVSWKVVSTGKWQHSHM